MREVRSSTVNVRKMKFPFQTGIENDGITLNRVGFQAVLNELK